MGAAASALESATPAELIELAESSNCNPALIEAIQNGSIDGKELFKNYNSILDTLKVASNIEAIEGSAEGVVAGAHDGLVLDFNGQTALWYIQWAIENNIPGYCQWMMKRAWAWSKCRTALEPDGWTFDQIQRGIIGCFSETGYGYNASTVAEWLTRRGETPGNGPELEAVETTGSVAYRIIKPATAESKLTYRQTFLTEADSRPATHFLSHSWAYPFWSVLEGLINHQLGYDRMHMYIYSIPTLIDMLKALSPEEVNYYWFDLFNKNQHIVTSDSTALELEQGIRRPGRVVVLLHPSENWALSRVWCLFEVLMCVQVQAQLEITYSFEMVDMFERQKNVDGDDKKKIPWYSLQRYSHLSTVDVAKAKATVESDRVYILGMIEKSIGSEALNKLVTERMTAAFEESSYGLGREKAEDDRESVDNVDSDFDVFFDERKYGL